MIEVYEILQDFDLCSSFTIIRTTGSFVGGGWQPNAPKTIPALGAVRNVGGKQLEQLPEEDRNGEILSFRSLTQMFTTTTNNADGNMQTSDVLLYQGSHYRVISSKNYIEQGYWLAMASRMEGT